MTFIVVPPRARIQPSCPIRETRRMLTRRYMDGTWRLFGEDKEAKVNCEGEIFGGVNTDLNATMTWAMLDTGFAVSL